jgi:hypothetical protein
LHFDGNCASIIALCRLAVALRWLSGRSQHFDDLAWYLVRLGGLFQRLGVLLLKR